MAPDSSDPGGVVCVDKERHLCGHDISNFGEPLDQSNAEREFRGARAVVDAQIKLSDVSDCSILFGRLVRMLVLPVWLVSSWRYTGARQRLQAYSR